MIRLVSIFLSLVLLLAACDPVSNQEPTLGPDGKPLPRVYRIGSNDVGRIQFRMVDSINSLRQASGVGTVSLNSQLNAAAATHSRDMSLQNRPWHFGSDGSSPIDRLQRVGYQGSLRGEAISETYESEVETLAAWMQGPNTRNVILDPIADEIGFSWYQESNGKIWWTLVMGATGSGLPVAALN